MQPTLSARRSYLSARTPSDRDGRTCCDPIDRSADTGAGRHPIVPTVPDAIGEAARLDRLGRATQAGRGMAITVKADAEYTFGRSARHDRKAHVRAL